MLEMLLQKPPAGSYYGTSGPGPKTLKYGNLQIGYFGTVTQAEMFTGPELANLLGFTAGINSATAAMYWWKFAYKGKILYIPSQQLRYFVSWNDIYGAGLVYGTKSNGDYPASPTAYQYNPVTKVEGPTVWGFVPRLMTGWPDPTYPGAGLDAYPQSSDSEWQQLLGRMCTSPNGNIAEKWDAKTPDQLSVTTTLQSWTQETQVNDVTKANNRGSSFNAYAIVGSASIVKTYAGGSDMAWRPVLELVPVGGLLNPINAVVEYAPMPQPPAIIFARQAEGPANEPIPLKDPQNVFTTWPTKQPVITTATFQGSALGPQNVRASGGANLNPFTITAAGTQLIAEPVNVINSVADLNPFGISVLSSSWLVDPVNVVYSLADLNPFTISGANIP
jgi:hypothetical protein